MTQTPVPVRAPRGTEISCKGWIQEAALRMLMNNLDPEVAEDPDNLIVYGGTGKAARNWECFHAIVRSLRALENDETLLIQSGKPVGVFRTTPDSPRVLIANSNLVGKWSNWEHFNELERKGLMMYGQMTAGSWIYIGSQGIVQGTYETFMALAARHFGNPSTSGGGAGVGASLAGKLVVSGGMGGMGGAQPLAATLAGASFLGIDVDPARIQKRIASGYCDRIAWSLDEALELLGTPPPPGEVQGWGSDTGRSAGDPLPSPSPRGRGALSVGLVGNCAEALPEMVRRGIVPDVLTDQTSAHDPLNGYVPGGITLAEHAELIRTNPNEKIRLAKESMAVHVQAMLDLKAMGAITFDYGNNIRAFALEAGCKDAFEIKGFVPEYIRPLFCTGKGPFRWAALSGDAEDIYETDRLALNLFPEDETLRRWLEHAAPKIQFQGLPARICWLGYGDRAKMGLAINDLVRTGKVKAPIVIGRDHLDCGSVASPNRETESMLDGSDAVADWAFLNAMVNTAAGASWVSIHNGGGVGIGFSQHAGMVVVADGTDEAAQRLSRVLTTDPGMGVIRHLDAGYEEAREFAIEHEIRVPMGDK